jgi:hypothetical protein
LRPLTLSALCLEDRTMAYTKPNELPREALARVRLLCTELPEVVEEQAWEGTRWTIRGKMCCASVAGNRKPTRVPPARRVPPAC